MTRRIGRGGFGSVYAAASDGVEVAAVKLLHPHFVDDPRIRARFAREIRAIQQIGHPNLVEILEVGELAGGTPFYAMELLSGSTARQLLRARGRLTLHDAVELLAPVVAAVDAAHRAGFVHRDLKLDNIHVGEVRDGQVEPEHVKLLDFGVAKLIDERPSDAKLTDAGLQIGTTTVMAPEQLAGQPVDGRADVYALGVVAFELVTGAPPFTGCDEAEVRRKHLTESPPRASERAPVPEAVDAILARCLAKRADLRYGSAGEVLDALREAARLAGADAAPVAYLARIEARPFDGAPLEDEDVDDIADRLDDCAADLEDAGFELVVETGTILVGRRHPTGSSDEREGLEAVLRRLVEGEGSQRVSIELSWTLALEPLTG